MDHLGFDPRSGAVFEGDWDKGFRVFPTPLILPVQFIDLDEKKSSNASGETDLLFREDSFDPIVKMRRGRVYYKRDGDQPKTWRVHDPHDESLERGTWGNGVAQTTELQTYDRDLLTERLKTGSLPHPIVALGSNPHISYWNIVSIERNFMGTPVLSLRARHSLGDIPELIESAIPERIRKPVIQELGKVESSMNRLGPDEVVDRCRGVLSLVFGTLSDKAGMDLSKAIEAYVRKHADNRDDLCSWSGKIVARLHSRTKPNEKMAKELRAVTDDDANLALECMKFVLIERGWAR